MENNLARYFANLKKDIKKDDIEGKVFTFDDPKENKSTRVKINKVNRILGKGSYSVWVAEVNVELKDDTRTEKKGHNMVVKRYDGEDADAVKDLNKSYQNYKALKEAEIPTWITYRINEEKKLALMTLGVKENEILLTANDSEALSAERFKRNPFKKAENLEEFVKKAYSILEKANAHSYRFSSDSYGIIFKPKPGDSTGAYNLDIIISDLDNLDRSDDSFYKKHYGGDIKQRWKVENEDHLDAALFCIFPGSRDQKNDFLKTIMAIKSRLNLA